MANTKATKATKATSQQAASGIAAVAAQVAQAVTANITAGTVARRPAVAITNGTVQVQAKQGLQTVAITGACANVASLPATNPALRGGVGSIKNGAATLTVGNGKGPKAGHNLAMWQVVTNMLPCTAQQAAQAVGSGGAAFVTYAIKNGWLANP